MARILIIEDDDDFSHLLRLFLEKEGYQVEIAPTAEEGLQLLAQRDCALILLDFMLPGMDGMACLAALQQRGLRIPTILMTGQGEPDVAIEAARRGAAFYIEKPGALADSWDDLLQRAREAVEAARLRQETVPLPGEQGRPGSTAFLGKSKVMLEVYDRVGRVADSQTAVLILGETGTGKELVARAIFQHDSRRRDKPFVAVNCAAIPEPLLESELFGHEKGAFAGAERRRIGKFEQANGGTILLDEIGDMSLDAQAKILRVLQEGEFDRIGGNEKVKVDVRVIACTHRDMEAAITAKTFRADLYYRLNGMTIRLPPLRHREGDILLLADHFLDRAAKAMARPRLSLHERAREMLLKYSWPGNVRELQKVVVRAYLVCRGSQIMSEDLELAPTEAVSLSGDTQPVAGFQQAIDAAWNTQAADIWSTLHNQLQRQLLEFAMAQLGGNRTAVAQRLGITRGTVIKLMDKWGLKE